MSKDCSNIGSIEVDETSLKCSRMYYSTTVVHKDNLTGSNLFKKENIQSIFSKFARMVRENQEALDTAKIALESLPEYIPDAEEVCDSCGITDYCDCAKENLAVCELYSDINETANATTIQDVGIEYFTIDGNDVGVSFSQGQLGELKYSFGDGKITLTNLESYINGLELSCFKAFQSFTTDNIGSGRQSYTQLQYPTCHDWEIKLKGLDVDVLWKYDSTLDSLTVTLYNQGTAVETTEVLGTTLTNGVNC